MRPEKKTEEDTISTVNTGYVIRECMKTSAVRCKGRMTVINIAQMEVCRLSNTVNVFFKR